MMVNKHTSLGTQDNKDFDPIDSYGAISDAEPNKGHTHPYPTNIKPFEDAASESKFRNSWEENDSDDEPYLADAYTYGRDDDDESEDELEERPHHANAIVEPQPSTPNHQHKMTFDQASDDENEVQKPSNSNVIRVSATNARASILSARSYSSHTKHHSFGYDQDRPEPSESESESNSESESDREESYMPALSSPASSQVPSGSRPASSTFSATKTLSKPGSPVLSRSTLPVEPEIKKHSEIDQSDKQDERPVSSPPSWSALDKSTPPPPEPSSTATVPSTPQHLQSASAISSSQTIERTSSSGSNTSRSSSGIGSPPITGYFQSNQTTLARSISSASSGRLSNGLHNQRPLSYSSLSDTSLNDISLDEPFTPNALKRNSGTIAPRVPVASSNAGFPSSFFGGKPHPKSQQYHQQQQPQPSPVSPQPVAAAASTSPEPRTGGVLNGSISSIASSISGAFMGRGFGSGNNSSATLPPSAMAKTPSRTSARGSGAGMMVNTSPTGIDLRPSNNVSPERASLYSTMTTDSNMDLLLSRLDAQNSMLEVDTKRRVTNDSEMDRAIGHAKEESVGEDVDWDYWGALMHDYNGVVKKNPKELTQKIQKGIPPALRGLIWQLLAKSKDAQLEASYAELLKATSSHEKQINRDMGRTFPNHEYFQAEGLGQESLFNVVKAYSLYDTEVGYCQGLSFVVGPLLLNMPDEEAFCVLVRMMNTYDMRGHFTPDMSTLQLRLYQYEQLMEETVPLIHKHFQNQGVRSTMYASQWFMTLFAYKFPLDLVFRIYDIMFVEGVESLLRFAIALLKANHDRILNHDFETLVEFLKNGLFEYYRNNPSLFVRDAYDVKVTPKKLAQYAQKYTAMVQRQQAELAAEDSLRESNRQLSMHVRRLEGSVHTLNKEHVELAKELITKKMEMAQLQDQNDVLLQKVSDLTKIVDSQGKEVEDRLKAEIQSVMEKNVELTRKNEQVEDQCNQLESMLIDTKMKYAESENERDELARRLSDLRKALGVA